MSQGNRNHPIFVSVAPPIPLTFSDQSGLDFSACLRWGLPKQAFQLCYPCVMAAPGELTPSLMPTYFSMCMALSPCVIIHVCCLGRIDIHGCI